MRKALEVYGSRPLAGGRGQSATRQRIRERGQEMSRSKVHTRLRDTVTGEIVGEGELSQTRARAIIKAYALAGLTVEAVA